MFLTRYWSLVEKGGELTEDEIEEGWFFCSCEQDGILINEYDLEATTCSCCRKKFR